MNRKHLEPCLFGLGLLSFLFCHASFYSQLLNAQSPCAYMVRPAHSPPRWGEGEPQRRGEQFFVLIHRNIFPACDRIVYPSA